MIWQVAEYHHSLRRPACLRADRAPVLHTQQVEAGLYMKRCLKHVYERDEGKMI